MRMYEYPNEGDLEEIKIELTKNCNLSCIHCSSNASTNNTTQLSCEIVLSLIKQAARLNVKSIVFSGGEPLLWPWLKDAIKSCKLYGINSSLYSTGINLDGTGTKQIAALTKYGLKKVIFSLYSPISNMHEEITRKSGSYQQTITTMKELGSYQLERELHFVPLKLNYKHLEKLIQLSYGLGIQRISILRFVPQGRGAILKNSQQMLMHKETIELRELILKCQRNYDIVIRLGSPYNILILNKEVDCIAARKTLCIGPNGNIYPCDAFKNIEPVEIGVQDHYQNINRNTLEKCWKLSKYLNIVRSYLSTPFGKPCTNCQYLEDCKSGCLAQKVIEQESVEDGNIIKRPDPLCIKKFIGEYHAAYK